MRAISKSVFLCLPLVFDNASSQETNALEINADVPTIALEARTADQNYVNLPALAFDLKIRQNCAAGLAPATLSMSVADTRRTMDAQQMSEDGELKTRLTVPARQIGPIALPGYCVQNEDTAAIEGSPSPHDEALRIPAVLSLQAALSCASETDRQIVYASAALDIDLLCREEPQAPADK